MSNEKRSDSEHRSDAEKVVKALRDRARVSAAFDRPAGEDVRAEINAHADFVEAADAKRDCTCPRWEDTCVCGAEESRRRYDAALARLREVLS